MTFPGLSRSLMAERTWPVLVDLMVFALILAAIFGKSFCIQFLIVLWLTPGRSLAISRYDLMPRFFKCCLELM